MNALEVQNLNKSFGNQLVLDDVSFHARKGRVLGFIGKNGAGKTTTMKIITGLISSNAGDVFIGNRKHNPNIGYKGFPIGYLPDVPSFYAYMLPQEYLKLCGEIMDLDHKEITSRSGELLELVGLKGVHKRIGTFSRGMKQRLGMAQALLGNPELLLCDEPTSALDPVGRKEILELINQIKEHTTVVFSTHVLSDVEQVCDDVAILDSGQIRYCGSMDQLKQDQGNAKLTLSFPARETANILSAKLKIVFPDTDQTQAAGKLMIALPTDLDKQEQFIQKLWEIIHQDQMILAGYQIQDPTLEQVFLELTQ